MTAETQPPIVTRPFQGDDDFGKVRDLLIETSPLTPLDYNWDIRRWDGRRYHREKPDISGWPEKVHLWETADGRLVGAVNAEGRDDAHLQLHPDYRHLQADMFAWAEAHLSAPTDDGTQRQLYTFVFEYDVTRRRLLAARGYEKTQYGGYSYRLRFGGWPLPPVELAEGYTLRTTRPGDSDDTQRVADVLNAGFNRDFHQATEVGNFFTMAPCFRHDLDLAAVAPDGSFAAYVGVIYDEANRRGIFEPVCTHPDHRRHGLARALMVEGLHRLQVLGAVHATVATGDQDPANRLYESVGFTEAYRGFTWRKVW